ncbi:MAG TPA: DoxX family membrane protein [Ohtaekwangia sp.]
MTTSTFFSWLLRLVAAFIMIQTLFFKFSGAEESIYIFSALGMEPWGRIGTGVVELIASVLLLVPRTTWIGSFLGIGLMSGALFFHLATLGIEVADDGGQLFIYALITLTSCFILLLLERQKITHILKSLFTR